MNHRRSVLWPLLFLLVWKPWLTVSAQEVLHLLPAPSQNRISENASRCMLKDSKGYIWVGTIDGLNRYDGYRFHIYRPDSRDSSSISGHFITCLREDSRGRLWVGTGNGLNLYDPLRDGFINITRAVNRKEVQTGDYINDVKEGENGRIWIATFSGLGCYDPERASFDRFSIDSTGHPGKILSRKVTALWAGTDGKIWIGYESGQVSCYERGHFTHFRQTGIEYAIGGLLPDKDGQLWVATHGGLFRFDPGASRSKRYLEKECLDVYTIDGQIWANVLFSGIYQWHPAEDQFRELEVYGEDERFFGDIKGFFKDREGILWATHHGLFKQDPYEKRFRSLRCEKGNPNSLNDPFVSGIGEDALGNWVVMTVNRGLNYYDRASDLWLNCDTDPRFDNELRHIKLSRFFLAGSSVYVTISDTIFEFKLQSGELKKYTPPDGGDNSYYSLVPVGEQKLWIGGPQIFLLDKKNGTYRDYSPAGWENGQNFRLYQDEEQHLWAISGNSIYHYDEQLDRILLKYQFVGDPEPGFGEMILSFLRDHSGAFWIGLSNGLERYDPRTQRLDHYSVADGLPNNVINSILCDDNGDLWLGTNNGLSRFNQKTGTFRNYDRADGIQDEIFLPGAAFRNKEGWLYFGGVNGFNVFHPDSLVGNNPHPLQVLITDFKIFNRSVAPGEKSVLSQSITDTRYIELNYTHSTISFELLALGYSQSHKNQYAYMIEGVDPDWNYVGAGHTASYTGLPRGEELIFKAKAANHDGLWSEQPTVLRLYIRPPVWETTWFRLSLLLLLLGLVLYYYRWRIRSIHMRNLWLENAVKAQTAEIELQAADLKQANLDLKQQAEVIREQVRRLDQYNKSQSRFFTNLSHEFRTPLTLLIGHLDELMHSPEPEKILDKVGRRMKMSARQLLLLINQLMDTAKLESGRYELKIFRRNIREEIGNICNSFQVLAEKKGLDLQMAFRKGIPEHCWYDPDILYKVLNNLLSNALKFTEKGRIRVVVAAETAAAGHLQLLLQISDTGVGIPEQQLPFIFDRFFQAEGYASARKKGSGIGLSLVKLLVKLHQGQIEVESKAGCGTLFTVRLPVDKQAFSQVESCSYEEEERPDPGQRGEFPPAATVAENAPGPKAGKDTPLLLIVEDNPDIASFLTRQLNTRYTTIEAEDGALGLKKALERVPDLIISDVVMPNMDGLDFCRQLKTDHRTSHIPVILLTALAEHEQKMRGLKHGADVYLSKPFSREELFLQIENLINHRDRLRQHFFQEYSLHHLPGSLGEIDRAFLVQLHELIETNLCNEQFGIEDMLKACGVSRTQLFRKLKSLTGMSATEFIRDYRLRKAFQLLNDEDLTVSEVIFATGFNSRSYFYECFRKKFGIAPTQLKKV